MQMVEGEVEKSHGFFDSTLHLWLQYLTCSQSRVHFLRHSNSSLQVAQTRGAKPFLIFASRAIKVEVTGARDFRHFEEFEEFEVPLCIGFPTVC